MPMVALITEPNHSSGGLLRYLVAVPSPLALGGSLVSLDWKVVKAIWMRCQRHSHKTQTVAAIGFVGLTLLWIILGDVSEFQGSDVCRASCSALNYFPCSFQ
jgi:hypothetical protein